MFVYSDCLFTQIVFFTQVVCLFTLIVCLFTQIVYLFTQIICLFTQVSKVARDGLRLNQGILVAQ